MRCLAVSGGGIEYRSHGVGQGRLGEDGPLYKARISIIECAHIAQCRRKIESTNSSVRRTEADRSSCREGQS